MEEEKKNRYGQSIHGVSPKNRPIIGNLENSKKTGEKIFFLFFSSRLGQRPHGVLLDDVFDRVD